MGTGVASFVLFALLLSLWESARASEVCLRRDCNLYDAPASKDRVCKMYNTTHGSIILEWYTGTLNSSRCDTSGKALSRDISKFCPGYVGMNMSLWCDFPNVTSVIYKDGVLLTNESTVTFNRLQKEDEGLYQCRRHGSRELIAEFSMTVQSEVHIGGRDSQECIPFHCYVSPVIESKCCSYGGWSPPQSKEQRSLQPMRLSVYGEPPINYSLAMEWATDSTDHYPTDLGAYIDRSPTDPLSWDLNFRHYPDNVNHADLLAAIVVTASNNVSTFSVCIVITFHGTDVYNADTSLPQETNTTVGGSATFVCEFGSNELSVVAAPLLSFEVSIPGSNGNSTFTTNCRRWDGCEKWSPNHPTTQLSIKPINKINKPNFILYQYEVQLTNVVQELNASQFSCSISTGSPEHILQWKGTAELIVEPALTGSPPIKVSNDEVPRLSVANQNAVTAAAVVLVVIVLALVTAISVILARFMKWRRNRGEESYELAQIPLTTLPNSTVSVSQSIANPEEQSLIPTTAIAEQYRLPAISIMEVGGVRRDVIVGREILHETRSTDSGVSCMEDYEHNVQKPPNTLGMTRAQQMKILESAAPVRMCRSETDIADSPPVATGVRTPQKKSVIYVSYTDHASQWVRSTLKPMIDSWDIANVMLPERDMVAGKAISNERRRLIVEADKIIVVISPDYYDSEWCSYELMHAIQNEPTLSRGRIIPILVDGCKHLPKNMEVVVPLFAQEQDFSQRLFAAIYPQPMGRLSLQ